MKKMFTMLLALIMVLGLFGCAGSGENGSQAAVDTQPRQTTAATEPTETAWLQAGYAKVDITPGNGVGLGGYSDNETRLSNGTLDKIFTTCVALSDGTETILVYTVDVCGQGAYWLNQIRSRVTSATGISAEKIFIGMTHTHSAPAIGGDSAADKAWTEAYYKACTDAATVALADLAPATMQATTAELERMNFVRHYLMNDGTYYGSNFGSTESGFKAHATDNDPQLILVNLDRETKKDILMINWQAHPAAAARQVDYNMVSADFVGHTRAKLENEAGVLVAYYTGASGNQNPKSLIEEEDRGLDYKQYGQLLGDMIIENMANLQTVEGTGIKTTKYIFKAEIDHSWDHMKAQADEVYDLWKSESKKAGDALGATYDFTSVYQARAIRTRFNKPASEDLELHAFRVGPIGFTTGTYEMFSDHSLYVKENSPFDITFLITANAGYIPNKASYGYRSYESDTGMYAIGTGEALAEEYVKLLELVK